MIITERHRADRVTVITTVKTDEGILLSLIKILLILKNHFRRDLHRGRTVIGKKYTSKITIGQSNNVVS